MKSQALSSLLFFIRLLLAAVETDILTLSPLVAMFVICW